MTLRHKSCKCDPLIHRLSTGYPQGEGLPLQNLLDVPEFFGEDGDGEVPSREAAPMRAGWPSAPSPVPRAYFDDVGSPYGAPGQPILEPRPRVKDSSVLLPQRPEMAGALAVAAQRGDIITSGAEGFSGDRVHTPTSRHYAGLAVDVRFAADIDAQRYAYQSAGYHVLREPTHLHVSFGGGRSGGAGAGGGW